MDTDSPGTSATTDGTTTDATTPTTPTSTSLGPVDISCTYPDWPSAPPSDPDVAPECACVGETGFLTCKMPLCPSIGGECVGNQDLFSSECHGEWKYDEAAVECALIAARDGVEGTILWGFSPNSGYSGVSGFLHILPDRRALRQDRSSQDLSTTVSDTKLWQLRDSDYFQGCLDQVLLCDRLACFFAGTAGNALSLCLEGFDGGYARGSADR